MKTQKPQLPTVDQLVQLSHYLQWLFGRGVYLDGSPSHSWKRKLKADWLRSGSDFEHTYRPGFEPKWYLLQQLQNSARPYIASLPDVLLDAIAVVRREIQMSRFKPLPQIEPRIGG